MRGVAEQRHVLEDEGLIADRPEGDPLAVVRDEAAAIQGICEYLADALDALHVAHPGRKVRGVSLVKARTLPDVLRHLDDERAGNGVHGVGVHLHDAPFSLLDEELEGVEHCVGAEPDELAAAGVDRRAELACVRVADRRIDAIAHEHEVMGCHEVLDGRGFGAEQDVHAVVDRPALEHMEQFLAAHRCEAVAADRHHLAVHGDVDVVPVGE